IGDGGRSGAPPAECRKYDVPPGAVGADDDGAGRSWNPWLPAARHASGNAGAGESAGDVGVHQSVGSALASARTIPGAPPGSAKSRAAKARQFSPANVGSVFFERRTVREADGSARRPVRISRPGLLL